MFDLDEIMNAHLGEKTGDYDMAGAVRKKTWRWRWHRFKRWWRLKFRD